VVFLGWACAARAHEVRPALLELTELGPARYEVLWKLPVQGGDSLIPITPVFPDDCHETSGATEHNESSVVARSLVECEATLSGRTLRIEGLRRTIIDTLVQVNLASGTRQSLLLRGGRDNFVVATPPSTLDVARAYVALGFEHIWLGFDHLSFVLGLIWLVRGWRRLLGALTAFTVAHSLTLALASLDLVHVPGPPVEGVIALSIVFLAVEIIHQLGGRPGWTARRPWAVSFSVGLLHGLGFAGALAEVGLPEADVPLALGCFNLGVELGQIAFVLAIGSIVLGVRRSRVRLPSWLPWGAAYALGTLAAFWAVQRTMSFI
jgi:hypothetical protein